MSQRIANSRADGNQEFAAIFGDVRQSTTRSATAKRRCCVYPLRVKSRLGKHTPHYDLAPIQTVVGQLGPAAFTKTAMDGIRGMGLTMGGRRSP